jgi:hypothetical protein
VIPHLNSRTSFKGTDQADRWREYVREIPVLRARVVAAVNHMELLIGALKAQQALAEENLKVSQEALRKFEAAADQITQKFDKWEHNHAGSDADSTTSPAACIPAPAGTSDPSPSSVVAPGPSSAPGGVPAGGEPGGSATS